uniref:uncharacterized protein LOC120340780 isoform X1 n=1 Tax=Styela clava TaxID=7725 RepID=UPI00193ACB89|nr:uncharacterized protein LOC120340780 isoform X1 [Styela clava]
MIVFSALLVFCFFELSSAQKKDYTTGADQYVLTVFLPLLAIAILACAGGCCYMERRRRRRKKRNGGIDPEELRQQQDFDDTASVISTASTRKRHYLNPTPTTGRLVRGVSVRSNYSTLGEPLYESFKKERSRNSTRNPDYRDERGHRNQDLPDYEDRRRQQRPNSRPSTGYGERPLSRSRSMVDVRYGHDDDSGSLRRTRSSTNLDKYRNSTADSGYPENQSLDEADNMYEYLNGRAGQEPQDNTSNIRYNRPPSPAQSDWSVRTAPPQTGYDNHMKPLSSRPSSRPSSMVDFPLPQGARERRPLSRMRSLSQPNLNAIGSKTYPQGILKKGPPSDEGKYPGMSNQTSNSSDSGIKDIYGEIPDMTGRSSRMSQRHTLPNMMDDMSNFRPSSRPASVMSYGSNANRRQSYDPYFTPNYGNYSTGMTSHHQHRPQSVGYNEPPVYSITGNGYHQQQMGMQDMYGGHQSHHGHNYDPYQVYGTGYGWGQQTHHQGHRYRASMY